VMVQTVQKTLVHLSTIILPYLAFHRHVLNNFLEYVYCLIVSTNVRCTDMMLNILFFLFSTSLLNLLFEQAQQFFLPLAQQILIL
jgi:hypothetical protein